MSNVVDKNMVIIAGHTRYKASIELGLKEVPVIIASDLTKKQVQAYRLADNKVGEFSMWDFALLDDELTDLDDFDMEQFGFGDNEAIEFEGDDLINAEQGEGSHLSDVFIIPPFSILDTRQGYLQDRKRMWKELGACSTEGRADNLVGFEHIRLSADDTGTSVFDPVLCEIMYRWFCPSNGKVFDPFAGGIPRGAVAYVKGLDYLGIDLSSEQIESNMRLIGNIKGTGHIQWINDDSLNMSKYIEDNTADFILTCPPYYDLEKYTDNPQDLSNMKYDDFVKVYSRIIRDATKKLKDDRFAVVVLSDVRDKSGAYRPLCDLTREVMRDSGLCVYNELILINSVGSASLRARQTFRNRKCVRSHQEVIVFYKGNPKNIQKEFPVLQAEDDVLNKEEESDDEGISQLL